jgi:hypothetical protein
VRHFIPLCAFYSQSDIGHGPLRWQDVTARLPAIQPPDFEVRGRNRENASEEKPERNVWDSCLRAAR